MSRLESSRQRHPTYPGTDPVSGIVSEKSWMNTVIEASELFGWYVYHTHDSRRSQAGFPDLVLIKPPRVLFIELKREKGKLSIQQRHVLGLLDKCETLETHVAYPSDWANVVEWLSQ